MTNTDVTLFRARHINMAFGPAVFPILQLPNKGVGKYTKGEWKKRVEKVNDLQ